MKNTIQCAYFLALLLTIAFSQLGFASLPTDFKSFDKFILKGIIDHPSQPISAKAVKKVIIIVHGSGPLNMDGDLSAVSLPRDRPNKVYKDYSRALNKKGFSVVRYNKRSYESAKKLKNKRSFKSSSVFQNYSKNPLKYFVKDLNSVTDSVVKMFPNANIYFLGHSQGAYIALQVAKHRKDIAGLALIGFSGQTLATSIFEQTVYHSTIYFEQLDTNADKIISAAELNQKSAVAQSLKAQLGILDLDKNGVISLSEYKAGNYSNLLIDDNLDDQAYAIQEAKFPRASKIIRDLKNKVIFIQGEWDNQTPAYNVKALQIANESTWKKKNLKFVYVPKAGHALDQRSSMHDLTYSKVNAKTLDLMGSELSQFFN